MSCLCYDEIMMKFPAGLYLRALRERQGMIQEDVVERLGVSVKQVGRWERGEQRPGGSTLRRLVDLLHASWEHVAILSDDTDGVDSVVASAFADDRLEEIRRRKIPVDPRVEQMESIGAHLLAVDSVAFGVWIGYGARLIDGLSDTD